MDGADDHNRADELAKKSATLNDGQRQEYEKRVSLATDDRGRVTDQYRLDIVNTLLQSLPRSEYGRQINDAERREQDRIKLADSRHERSPSTSAVPIKQLNPEPNAPVREDGKRQPAHDDPMAGVQRHAAPHDYTELRRTHEQVAATRDAERSGRPDSATAILSKEQLQSMAERYAEVRKASHIDLTPTEQRKHAEEAKMQATDRERLDRARGSTPNDQQKQEPTLLDHQQLAERVGSEALRLGQYWRKQGAPGAESYEREARSAFDTARRVREQRQNPGPGPDRVREAARVVRQDEQQKQSAAQEAVRDNSPLTSEQRANASPDVKQTLDRKERADSVRSAGGADEKSQSARNESAKPGNTRSGGRGR